MDVINSLHGVIMFIVMVVFRKSIWSKVRSQSEKWTIFTDNSESLQHDNYYASNIKTNISNSNVFLEKV